MLGLSFDVGKALEVGPDPTDMSMEVRVVGGLAGPVPADSTISKVAENVGNMKPFWFFSEYGVTEIV